MAWWDGIGTATCTMPLTDGHRLRWRRGSLLALHHDVGDRVLGALGGDVCPCLLVLEVAGQTVRADDASVLVAELLDRLGGLSPHLAVGKADLVAAAAGSEDPERRRLRAFAATHLVPAPVLDRVVLSRLVAMERRPPFPGTTARWALEAAIGVRASRAARQAFGGAARGPVRVLLQLCEPDEPPHASVDGPASVRLTLAASWLREVWWPGPAVGPGGRLYLEPGRAVRLERRRGAPAIIELPLEEDDAGRMS